MPEHIYLKQAEEFNSLDTSFLVLERNHDFLSFIQIILIFVMQNNIHLTVLILNQNF